MNSEKNEKYFFDKEFDNSLILSKEIKHMLNPNAGIRIFIVNDIFPDNELPALHFGRLKIAFFVFLRTQKTLENLENFKSRYEIIKFSYL